MKLFFILTLFLFSLNISAKRDRSINREPLALKAFESDGCSSYPDGYADTLTNEWLHCCYVHDIQYWVGGKKEARSNADKKLGQCIEKVTTSLHGKIVKLGVQIGGSPYIATLWRWGYGWNKIMGYEELTDQKIKMIEMLDFTILNDLASKSHRLTPQQLDYILNDYEEFRQRLKD